MKILEKINFRQPKYMLPAILYFPLLGTSYFIFDLFQTETIEIQDKALQTTEFLNPELPGAQIKDDGIGSKYENMAKSWGKIQDYSAVDNIDREEPDKNKEEYESKYTQDDIDLLTEEQQEKAAAADSHGRLNTCRKEMDFIRRRERYVDVLLDLQERGELPVRIVHNDTKINNVMLDRETDKAVCVIDLDTVMPGSVLYDFGDMVRTMTSPAAEDEENLDKTFLRMPMFEAVVKGYLEAARDFITPQEVSKLAFSGLLITLETGIRFLTDYLEGDVYFKTKKERHNLHRARTQLRLVESMEEQMPEMEECVRKCFQTVNG